MSEKKLPPGPNLPPKTTLRENYCLFHKGDITGELYTCPSCKTTYCLSCAKKAKEEKRTCVKCKQLIFL